MSIDTLKKKKLPINFSLSSEVLSQKITSKEIKERTQQLTTTLKHAGFLALPHSRGPLGNNIFSMSLGDSSQLFKFWLGTANAEIIDVSDFKKPQAVIKISEEQHDIILPYVNEILSHNKLTELSRSFEDIESCNPESIKAFFKKHYVKEVKKNSSNYANGVTLPVGSTFVLDDISVDGCSGLHGDYFNIINFTSRNKYSFRLRVRAKATVPSFVNYFLIGYDEESCFVSQLPQAVSSIKEAHASLRPLEISPNALRQGEWFFDPVSSELAIELDKAADKEPRKAVYYNKVKNHKIRSMAYWNSDHGRFKAHELLASLEPSSSHCSYIVKHGGVLYAKDAVVDTRSNRHKTLILDGWHRVYRNREVINVADSYIKSRRQSWD